MQPISLRFGAYSVKNFDDNVPLSYNPSGRYTEKLQGYVYVPKETLHGCGGGFDRWWGGCKLADQYQPDGTLVKENVEVFMEFNGDEDDTMCDYVDAQPSFTHLLQLLKKKGNEVE